MDTPTYAEWVKQLETVCAEWNAAIEAVNVDPQEMARRWSAVRAVQALHKAVSEKERLMRDLVVHRGPPIA